MLLGYHEQDLACFYVNKLRKLYTDGEHVNPFPIWAIVMRTSSIKIDTKFSLPDENESEP